MLSKTACEPIFSAFTARLPLTRSMGLSESRPNSRSGTLPLALGTGLPVVAVRGLETDLDLFRDGENISFATEMTGPAFAEVVLRLLDDPAMRQRIGAAARLTYEKEMSWSRTADLVLDTQAVIDGAPPAGP